MVVDLVKFWNMFFGNKERGHIHQVWKKLWIIPATPKNNCNAIIKICPVFNTVWSVVDSQHQMYHLYLACYQSDTEPNTCAHLYVGNEANTYYACTRYTVAVYR